MVDLEQIKADIAARKAMPAWGPQTSIERIRTINATLPSFSLKTVEALVEVLEVNQRANAAQDDHINQVSDRVELLEKTNGTLRRSSAEWERKAISNFEECSRMSQRITELESRTGTKAINDVIAERQRQQTVKGFSTEQDDTYVGFQLSAAAICYVEPMEAENYWPADWYDDSFKPTDTRRNLIKAAALIIAEIERMDRQLPEGGL